MKRYTTILATLLVVLAVVPGVAQDETAAPVKPSACKHKRMPKLCHIQDCTVSTSVDIVDFTNEVYQLSIDLSWGAPGHGEQHRLVFVQAKPGEGRVETERRGGGFRGAFTALTAGLEVLDQTNSLIAAYDVTFIGHADEMSFTSGSVSFPHTRFWKDWAESQEQEDSKVAPRYLRKAALCLPSSEP
ncbi:MAG: hypothetical protein HQ523_08640 [Lentisphaerae bacterium]|nr:hypothetical protein [Lentisphaerota bacterium]